MHTWAVRPKQHCTRGWEGGDFVQFRQDGCMAWNWKIHGNVSTVLSGVVAACPKNKLEFKFFSSPSQWWFNTRRYLNMSSSASFRHPVPSSISSHQMINLLFQIIFKKHFFRRAQCFYVASRLQYLSLEEFTVFQQGTRFNCKQLKAGNFLVRE